MALDQLSDTIRAVRGHRVSISSVYFNQGWATATECAEELRTYQRGLHHAVELLTGRALFERSWLTSTVVGLADAIYADRAFDRLPILADALEEAGCDHPNVPAHCRGPGPHARGCWVVDLLLGKS